MRLLLTPLLCILLISCSADNGTPTLDVKSSANNKVAEQTEELIVYKSPTCGCCGGWVEHLNRAGIKTQTVDQQNMASVKESLGVDQRLQSCHTAQFGSYYFEGHVPISSLKTFLKEQPKDAKGLAVPAMPIGSLGMEDGDKFQPYQVWLVKDNGEIHEYASIETYAQQF